MMCQSCALVIELVASVSLASVLTLSCLGNHIVFEVIKHNLNCLRVSYSSFLSLAYRFHLHVASCRSPSSKLKRL